MLTFTLLFIYLTGQLLESTELTVCESTDEYFEEIVIPTIDISSFTSGDNITRLQIANLFDVGLNKYGIIRVINHEIPLELIDNIFIEMKNFFHDNLNIKMEYNIGDFGAPGYIPKEKESHYLNSTEFEPTESFHFVANYSDLFSMQCGYPYFPFNSQNGLPIHFTDSNISKYYYFLRKLLKNIHQIASIALGYKYNIFESKMNENSFLGLRMTYYYQMDKMDDTRNGYYLRLNEHRDFAGFALIQNDKNNANGFQIKYDNKYYNIKYVENSMLILGGDFIRFLTNNYWKSVLHRVLTKNNVERFAMIGFSGTDLKETIDLLQDCNKCNIEQRKFHPVVGQEWLEKRVNDANAMNNIIT